MDKNSSSYQYEYLKIQIRAKVEHSFATMKRQFDYDKVRCRGLSANTNRLYLLAGFSNLIRVKTLLT